MAALIGYKCDLCGKEVHTAHKALRDTKTMARLPDLMFSRITYGELCSDCRNEIGIVITKQITQRQEHNA